MREYETAFIVQPEISDEACQELCARLDSILEKHGAKRVMLDDWGKRKLAYEIQKFQKGHYFVLYYLDDGKVVTEIQRALRLEESVLRFLTVRAKDSVDDVEARLALGAEQERIQREKAAERAAREAEAERAAREAADAAPEAAPGEDDARAAADDTGAEAEDADESEDAGDEDEDEER